MDGVAKGGIDGGCPETFCQIELARVDVHGKHLRRAEMFRELDRGDAQSADSEDRGRFSGTETDFVQGVKGSSGRAHQDGALLERNFVRQSEHAPFRHRDEFGVTAVAMFADHFRVRAELLVAMPAKSAFAAGNEVMNADAIARFE